MGWLQSIVVPVVIGVASSLAASYFADRSNARQFEREREAAMLAALVKWRTLLELRNLAIEDPEWVRPKQPAIAAAEDALDPFLHELPEDLVGALRYQDPNADERSFCGYFEERIESIDAFVAARTTRSRRGPIGRRRSTAP